MYSTGSVTQLHWQKSLKVYERNPSKAAFPVQAKEKEANPK